MFNEVLNINRSLTQIKADQYRGALRNKRKALSNIRDVYDACFFVGHGNIKKGSGKFDEGCDSGRDSGLLWCIWLKDPDSTLTNQFLTEVSDNTRPSYFSNKFFERRVKLNTIFGIKKDCKGLDRGKDNGRGCGLLSHIWSEIPNCPVANQSLPEAKIKPHSFNCSHDISENFCEGDEKSNVKKDCSELNRYKDVGRDYHIQSKDSRTALCINAIQRNLTDVAIAFSRSEHEEIRALSSEIRHQLNTYTDTCDERLVWSALRQLVNYEVKVIKSVKLLAKASRVWLKELILRKFRDVRQFYRAIVRFLFKNMDSDIDDDQASLSRYGKEILLYSFNTLIHDRTRSYYLLRKYG
ncbi:MAG TPA: hypothetical protein VNS58_13930 [Puia sp.]|nr:hypothetical protein [Puia sp.]